MRHEVKLNGTTMQEYGCMVVDYMVEPAEVKMSSQSIDGMDGAIDYTEWDGRPHYKQREIKLTVGAKATPEQWETILARIQNTVSGKEVRVSSSRMPGYYYSGRAYIKSLKHVSRMLHQAVIIINAHPWALKETETVITRTVNGSITVACQNDYMMVYPIFECTAEMGIGFAGNNYTAKASAPVQFDGIVFAHGTNAVTITGTGKITIRYQEGRL